MPKGQHLTKEFKIALINCHKELRNVYPEKSILMEKLQKYLGEMIGVKIFEYLYGGQCCTLDDLLAYVREETYFTGSRTLLHKIIRDMGFRYKKINERKIMCEKNYIKHTEQLIIDDWKKYMGNMDIVNVPPLIIGFENDSASDSDTDMPSENDEEYVE
ncbi:hypothetical protein ABEB36_007956 [Hypothenemus hampei]|uniref:Uncharacterized protein n=1 Tax=Hypothenemus hampei TaxID=57062 RepID=A0ABD1EVR3_HYPHA